MTVAEKTGRVENMKEEDVREIEAAADGGFSDYEKLRNEQISKADSKSAVPKAETENVKAEKVEVEEDVETPDVEDTPTDAESSGNDSDADAGEKSDGKEATELPQWMQKRLDREKRKTERERKKREDLEKRLEALEKAAATVEPKEKEMEAQADDGDEEPMSDEDYDYDFPERGDYKSEQEWLDDTDRWERNIPLKGGKSAKKPERKAAPEKKAPAPQANTQLPENNIVNLLFEDVRDIIDESDNVDENLGNDFFEMLEKRRFGLSMKMLDWMADNDEADIVAAEFVRSPRVANRIFKRPEGSHAKLLKELVSKLKGKDASQKREPEKKVDSKDETPVLSALRAGRTSLTNGNIADSVSFREYESLRNGMSAGRR